MSALRADAARSRARILEVAATRDRDALRLNEVARAAGVGVGTVYRHFPTVEALSEALTAETVERALALTRRAAAEPDPHEAFFLFFGGVLDLLVADDGLQAVLMATDNASEQVRSAKAEMTGLAMQLLARAQRAGVVRDDLTFAQVSHLMCGLEHAVRLGEPGDRVPLTAVLSAGMRAV